MEQFKCNEKHAGCQGLSGGVCPCRYLIRYSSNTDFSSKQCVVKQTKKKKERERKEKKKKQK